MGTTNSDEKVTWDDGLSWIDNVLQNIDDYLILNRARGGDDARFEAMQELKTAARLAKKSHDYQTVRQKAIKLKDKQITQYGFWGSWGKASFSYKILETIVKQALPEKEIRHQQTPGLTTEVHEKGLMLKVLQEKVQLAKNDAEKIKALTALNDELKNANAALEGNLREVSADNDALKAAQQKFDDTKRRFDRDMTEAQNATIFERDLAKQAQNNLVALRKDYDQYISKMKATVKLAEDSEGLKTQNAQLQAAIEENKRAVDLQQQKFTALQKELENANAALETADAEIRRLKERDKLINAEVTALNTVQQNVKEKEQKAERSKLILSDDLSSLKAEVRLLKEQLEARLAEIKQLDERHEVTCRLLSEKTDELKNQKRDNEDVHQSYEKVITQKGEENFKLRQFINTLFVLLKEIVSMLSGDNKIKFDAKVNALEEQKKQLLTPAAPTPSSPKATTPKPARKNSRVVEIAAPPNAKAAANTAQRSGSPLHHADESTSSSPASASSSSSSLHAASPASKKP